MCKCHHDGSNHSNNTENINVHNNHNMKNKKNRHSQEDNDTSNGNNISSSAPLLLTERIHHLYAEMKLFQEILGADPRYDKHTLSFCCSYLLSAYLATVCIADSSFSICLSYLILSYLFY